MTPTEGGSGGERLVVERAFIGGGCNRIVNNVSWGPSGLVSFGTQDAVAIFCHETAQILTTLPGHKSVVNCTQWVPNKKDFHKVQDREINYLLSGSFDGVIILWEIHPKIQQWNHIMQLPEVHKKGVTCIVSIMISENTAIFASTSSDGIVLISELTLPFTHNGECQVSLLDTISVGNKPMVALSLSIIPNEDNSLLLAMAGLDQKIHIYYSTRKQKFIHACELKGHSDWIRSLDFSLPISTQTNSEDKKNHDIFLASSSQDKTICIWKLSSSPQKTLNPQSSKDDYTLASYISGPSFKTGSTRFDISLESLLTGHEDWVYSVEWQPVNTTSTQQTMSLLSASMDKTMMIWKPELNSGIWVNVVTVGELGNSCLGFYGGQWGGDGKWILAYGYGGDFHLWRDIGCGFEDWKPQRVPSGHFASVFDLSWSRDSDYIISVGHDQTTRIFCPWRNIDDNKEKRKDRWHEIARPQVHGHDINCICIVEGSGNHRFVSGADEKVARVFEAPLSFLKTLNFASSKEDQKNFEDLDKGIHILGANMSALGLSQKPIYSNSTRDDQSSSSTGEMDGLERIPDAVPTVFESPPVEEQLSLNTLWPESHKLYGHGNELISLCCNHAGNLVASSCKAKDERTTSIMIWEVGTWKRIASMGSHKLTVTQMEFSHDDEWLLSVSRDRQLSVRSVKLAPEYIEGFDSYSAGSVEGHKRIIWACAWNPLKHEFATGSRDKTVKIWGVNRLSSPNIRLITTLPRFQESVTALAWNKQGLVAVGMENGLIEIWRVNCTGSETCDVECVVKFDPFLCHVSSVYRLRWRVEDVEEGERKVMKLASCGADHSVRVFDLYLK